MWLVAPILGSAGLDYVSGRGAFIEGVGMTCKDIEGKLRREKVSLSYVFMVSEESRPIEVLIFVLQRESAIIDL